jgi:hypothetical protein
MDTEKQLFLFQVECYMGTENNEDLYFVHTIAESPKKARENMRKIPSFRCAITTLCEKAINLAEMSPEEYGIYESGYKFIEAGKY